jgi:hypothetical protein
VSAANSHGFRKTTLIPCSVLMTCLLLTKDWLSFPKSSSNLPYKCKEQNQNKETFPSISNNMIFFYTIENIYRFFKYILTTRHWFDQDIQKASLHFKISLCKHVKWVYFSNKFNFDFTKFSLNFLHLQSIK